MHSKLYAHAQFNNKGDHKESDIMKRVRQSSAKNTIAMLSSRIYCRAPICWGTLLLLWLFETMNFAARRPEVVTAASTFPMFDTIDATTAMATRRNVTVQVLRERQKITPMINASVSTTDTMDSAVAARNQLKLSKKTPINDNDNDNNNPVHKSQPNVEKGTVQSALLGVPLTEYQQKSSPVQDLLKVYVYDNLPAKFSTDIQACIQEESFPHQQAETLHTEMALIRLFQTFPGRTYDPNEADIFVVPYMHNAHYMFCHKDQYMNKYMINRQNMEDPALEELFQSLTYYNETSSSSSRHLFFAMAGPYLTNIRIDSLPFVITPGPKRTEIQFRRTRRKKPSPKQGHFIVPLFNHHPSYQPSSLLQKNHNRIATGADNWWTDTGRRRQYAFVYIAGLFNPNMKSNYRRFRQYFYKYTQEEKEMVLFKMLGGRPFVIQDSSSSPTTIINTQQTITQDNNNNNITISHATNRAKYYSDMYQDSVFCPILPGDTSWQLRFFDVILNGCLPVVWAWKKTFAKARRGYLSWYVGIRYPPPVEESYPFVSKQFGYPRDEKRGTAAATEQILVDEMIDIDYESFVVQCTPNATAESDVSPMMHAMEKLLSSPEELATRQLAMQKAALSFTYGVGPDAHRYEDAFAHLIRTIRRDVVLPLQLKN